MIFVEGWLENEDVRKKVVLVVVTVFVDEVEEGRRDRIADLGVITRSVGDRGGAVAYEAVGDSFFIGENKSKS